MLENTKVFFLWCNSSHHRLLPFDVFISKMQPCIMHLKCIVLPKNTLKGVIALELQVIFIATFMLHTWPTCLQNMKNFAWKLFKIKCRWEGQLFDPIRLCDCSAALSLLKVTSILLCLHNSRYRRGWREKGGFTVCKSHVSRPTAAGTNPYPAAQNQDHVLPQSNYNTYWRSLTKCGLWKDPAYQTRKVELGDQVNAVWERMPNCESFLNAW